MTTLNYSSQPASIPYQPHSSHNPTPLSSATATPTGTSPTILRSNSSSSTALPYLGFQTRQLRPPKSPLYIPAVLRPTERPSRYTVVVNKDSRATSPLTPPQSAGNSFDGADAGILSFMGADGIPRRLIGDDLVRIGVTRVVTDEWNEDLMEDVTGMPTQDHWKPDSSSVTCDSPSCKVPFSFLTRRHHCRRCGNIFCSSHSPHVVPLDQHARFHPDGSRARACESCWADFRTWESTRRSRNNSSESGSSGNSTISGGPTPATGLPLDAPQKVVKAEMPAGSVSRDWNWSTF